MGGQKCKRTIDRKYKWSTRISVLGTKKTTAYYMGNWDNLKEEMKKKTENKK